MTGGTANTGEASMPNQNEAPKTPRPRADRQRTALVEYQTGERVVENHIRVHSREIAADIMADINLALAQVNPLERAIIELRARGNSYQVIAGYLSKRISSKQVNRVHRAVQIRLCKLFPEYDPEPDVPKPLLWTLISRRSQ